MKQRHILLSHRLAFMIALFAVGFAIFGAWSFKTLNELKVNGPIYQRIVQGKDLVADILPPPEYILESYLVTLQLAAAPDKTELGALVARLTSLKADYDTRHAFWLKENLDAGLSDLFLKQAHAPALAFYKTAFDALVPAAQRGDAAAVTAALARMKPDYEAHRKVIDRVVEITAKRTEDDEASAKSQIRSGMLLMLIILGVALGSGILVATLIARGVLKSIGGEPEYATDMTNRMAAGDLGSTISVAAGRSGSLLGAIKSLQEMMIRTTTEIKLAVDGVSTGSHQIATGNLDLSQRTELQASALQETSASMAQLTSTIRQNADSAQQANLLAVSAAEVAQKGGAVVSKVVTTMGAINDSAKKIADIIGVIDSIAFQTNILALNAAVEAARAGEQGRGFAVVATEVRTLAQRSAAAAREIKSLITDSVAQVAVGSELVQQAGTTMDEILERSSEVTAIMGTIAIASREQTTGINHINSALDQMDDVTQQNAALVEQAAAAAAALQAQANGLAQLVSVFRFEKSVPLLPTTT